MKHLSGLWHKLTFVVAVTAALSSCNRAEYAMLPKTTSYHGTAQRAVTVAPATKETAVTKAATVAEAPASAAVATTEAHLEVSATPVATAEKAPQAIASATTTASKKVAIAPKLNLAQKALVQKVERKAEKLASKIEFKQRTEVAGAERLEGKLRQGIILIIVGLLVGLLGFIPGLGTLIGIISGLLILVGAVLIVLYLLDEL
jgi:hypothetical protein